MNKFAQTLVQACSKVANDIICILEGTLCSMPSRGGSAQKRYLFTLAVFEKVAKVFENLVSKGS